MMPFSIRSTASAPRLRRRSFGLAAAAACMALPLRAQPRRLVVAELFTSQGCSSCPPADALLTELAEGAADVLPLAYHVTYWDRLGWRDPFALQAATARQRQYAALWHADEVYTPQMVVDGRQGMVGSDRAAVQAALQDAAGRRAHPIQLQRSGAEAVVQVAEGAGSGIVLLVGYDGQHQTAIGRGENGGRTLTESNIVRGIVPAGAWTGATLQTRLAAPAGEHLAALLQAPDGTILGAARAG